MKNYIQEWAHGEETSPEKKQVSARIDVEIIERINELVGLFGVNKTSVIEGALDIGTRHLLEEASQASIRVVRSAAEVQGKTEEFNKVFEGSEDA
jgi:hypothetical protein